MQHPHPDRVLVVSANMGEGHNATARALTEAAVDLWPECTVTQVDTLEVMGRGVGPLFRSIYVGNVQHTPWLYEYFYASLWRHAWFARASKAVVGAWAGPALRRIIEEVRPDLVLSTYPLGSAGLAWLRRHDALPQPAAAWVSDFSPHPFWVYRELDRTYVMHDRAVPVAHRAQTGATVTTCAPPVVASFTEVAPQEAAAARHELGVSADDTLVLVSSGAFGFGTVERAVEAVLDAGPSVHVAAVTGRNLALREKLLAGAGGDPRAHVLGWVEDMPRLLGAADAVISNAGGASALEALAARVPVIMFQPIAAHGRANAQLMELAGLTSVCTTPAALTSRIRRVMGDADGRPCLPAAPSVRESLRVLASSAAEPRRPLGAVRTPPAVEPDRPDRNERLAPADALFLDIDSGTVPQQIGTVLVLDTSRTGPLGPDVLARLAGAIPRVRSRLDRGGWFASPSRRPEDPAAGPEISQGRIDGTDTAALGRAVDAFFGVRLDLDAPAARLRLLSGLPDGRQAVLIQVHHALCDGVALIEALVAEAEQISSPSPPRRHEPAPAPGRRHRRHPVRSAVHLVHGILALARAGRAPATPLSGPIDSRERRHVMWRLSGPTVRGAATAHDCSVGELLLGLLAETVAEVAPAARPDPRVRVLVPRSLHRGDSAVSGSGNRTGATPVDLPVGRMPIGQRITATRAVMRRHGDSHRPRAAREVVQVVGALPPPVRRGLNRLMYRSTWFSSIATVLPGLVRDVEIAGRAVEDTFPVLPLAPGVQLSFGAIPRRDVVDVCLTLGPRWADRAGSFERAFAAALDRA